MRLNITLLYTKIAAGKSRIDACMHTKRLGICDPQTRLVSAGGGARTHLARLANPRTGQGKKGTSTQPHCLGSVRSDEGCVPLRSIWTDPCGNLPTAGRLHTDQPSDQRVI